MMTSPVVRVSFACLCLACEAADESDLEPDRPPLDDGTFAAPLDPSAIGGDRMRRPIAIAGHGAAACFLPEDGIPRCIGTNSQGQLGQGYVDGPDADVPIPIIGLDRVRSLGTTSRQVYALRA